MLARITPGKYPLWDYNIPLLSVLNPYKLEIGINLHWGAHRKFLGFLIILRVIKQ